MIEKFCKKTFFNEVKTTLAENKTGQTYFLINFYRPQRSCVQGYVFTRVCDSVNRGGSPENPPLGTKETLPRDQADPPRDQGEPPRDQAHPPRPRRPPPGRTLQHTVNERPVRILLECILVYFLFLDKIS